MCQKSGQGLLAANIQEKIWLMLQLYQLATRGSGRFNELEAMDWTAFVSFIRNFMNNSGPSKEKTSEGQEIWDRLQGDEKYPLGPRNLHGHAMRIGETLNYSNAQSFTDEQEREVITFIRRKRSESNPTEDDRRAQGR